MSRFVLRLWLDDRPGALGSVASRIGSVKADLVGIEILERGAGRVIDELIVDLPSDDLIDLMVREIQEVDGVDVENISLEPNPERDSRIDPLLTVAIALEQESFEDFVNEFVKRLALDYMTKWVVAFDLNNGVVISGNGEPPLSGWIKAYLDGLLNSSVKVQINEPDDLALVLAQSANIAFVLGRLDRPFRDLERAQLDAISRIVGVKLSLLLI